MIDLLQKIIIFGRFSVKQNDGELIVKQRNYFAIFSSFFALVIILLIFYFKYQKYGLAGVLPQNSKEYVGAILIVCLLYLIFRNIFLLSKKHILIIKYSLREIWYNSVKIPLNAVTRFEIHRNVSLMSYYYSIVVVYFSNDEKNNEDGVNDLIFLPTKFTKLFLIDIANEANKLLINKTYSIKRKLDLLEIGNILIYTVFGLAVLFFVYFMMMKMFFY